jgi:SAM-dependent methyltransferase
MLASCSAGLPEADMNLRIRIKGALRGAKQRWGSNNMKRRLWNQEFSSGHWESLESTPSDVVYHYVEKYCRRGSILDLGCGSGNTGCELDAHSYQNYTGVDISDVALEKAQRRSEMCERGQKNHYVQADVSTYIPDAKFDVILFRESIYYIPRRQIRATLGRYSRYLNEGGVFIVRQHNRVVADDLVKIIEGSFETVGHYSSDPSGPVVLIFRPEFGVSKVGMPGRWT